MRVLSFGGGVQTVGLLALMAHGELAWPDYVIFADTGAERPDTYGYVDQVAKPVCQKASVPFLTVQYRDLYEYCWEHGWLPQPFKRRCTKDFKIMPIRRKIRQLNGRALTQMIVGISADESHRRRASQVRYIQHAYPLCDLRMTRLGVVNYLEDKGWPVPPRSACYFCPFQRLLRWKDTQWRYPELIEKAKALEARARERRTGPAARFCLTGFVPLERVLEGDQLAFDQLLESWAALRDEHP